jgi:vacuolar protein sorting-associated protein 54
MEHAEFLVLMQELYLSLLNGVEGLQEQGRVIIDIMDSLNPYVASPMRLLHPSNTLPRLPKITPTTTPTSIQDELADILSSSAELSNTQAAKVISLRADQHATLELADFLVFFNESWGFVVKCEIICRRMIVGLRGVVVSQVCNSSLYAIRLLIPFQAKVFLQTFHQARITQSAKLVEDEQWNPAEVSPSLQRITDVLVDSAVRDSPELVIKSDADTLFPNPLSINGTSNSTVNTNGKGKGNPPPAPIRKGPNGFNPSSASGSKHLLIDGRTYFAVSATAEVLVLLLDYLRVVVNLSLLTTDTMSRVIEFLKAFNSRTCQVVLGAGAMRSAGLKNITAKHLGEF